MRKLKQNSLWIALLLMVTASLAAAFYPVDGIALGGGPNEEWLVTPEAQEQDKNEELCPPNAVCKELCYDGVGQGYFQCFFI